MRNNSDIKRSRKLRIAEITQKISELTRELEEILQLDSSDDNTEPDIQIGDTVIINNSYKGLRGATGTVVTIFKKQVEIKLKDNSKIVRRNKSNISKVN